LKWSTRKLDSFSTQIIGARHPSKNVLAKAVFHLHRLPEGKRTPLPGNNQIEAWDALVDWRVDAVGELTDGVRMTSRARFNPMALENVG
jgi:hypothetical protein